MTTKEAAESIRTKLPSNEQQPPTMPSFASSESVEVVVIPYRPPPSITEQKSDSDTLERNNEQPDTKRQEQNNPPSSSESAQPPPAIETMGTDDGPEFMRKSPTNPARQVVTPRSAIAMVEAVCEGIDVTSSSSGAGSNSLAGEHRVTVTTIKENSDSSKPSDSDTGNNCDTGRRQSIQTTAAHVNTGSSEQQINPQEKTQTDNPKNRPRQTRKSLSYIQLAKLGYQELVHAIIRPPRSSYPKEALGPESFRFCNAQVKRKDFDVKNKRGMSIKCSLWSCSEWSLGEDIAVGGAGSNERPDLVERADSTSCCLSGRVVLDDWDESKERGKMYLHVDEEENSISISDESCDGNAPKLSQPTSTQSTYKSSCSSPSTASNTNQSNNARKPMVIYLHGNSSSRLEVIPQLGHLLSLGLSVLSFDFCGSGHSEGEYVSLGYYEREDLDSVISFLRKSEQVSSLALWGRSMGAATALMYASRDPTISCMILDSAFTDLQRLSQEIVEKGRRHGVNVPNIVLQMVMRLLKSSVKQQAGFSIRHLSPISHADKCFVPAMFVAGEHDDFIHKGHSIMIHRKYAGDKNIVIVDGDHNSPRPRFLLQSACMFLQSCMGLPASDELVVPLGVNLLMPPWLLGRKGIRSCPLVNRGGRNKSVPERSWLPVRQEQKHEQQQQRRKQMVQGNDDDREQTDCLGEDKKMPPDMPLDSLKESSHLEDEALAASASALPDMAERQKDIQSSLFRMLGQSSP